MTEPTLIVPENKNPTLEVLPAELQLSELEVSKITALTATAELVETQIRLLVMKTQKEVAEKQDQLTLLRERQRILQAEISQRLGVPSLAAYQVNMESGKATLRAPRPE